jgi:hypothetical protein
VGLAATCLSGACTGPTGPTTAPILPFTIISNASYSFFCGRWGGQPPATRTLIDLFPFGGSPDAPGEAQIEAIEAAGGQVVYRFHADAVRAMIDVDALPALGAGPNETVNWARTVTDPSSHLVDVLVGFDHKPTADDVAAMTAGGGAITSTFLHFNDLGGNVADLTLPSLRARPGVTSVDLDVFGCLVAAELALGGFSDPLADQAGPMSQRPAGPQLGPVMGPHVSAGINTAGQR